MSKFVMNVKEIFHFQDGRTLFLGEILSDAKYIRQCDCSLVVNNQKTILIHIEGEWTGGRNPQNLRAISTKDVVDFRNLNVQEDEISLICED